MISAKELQKSVGATYRQVDYWCRKGYLQPTNDPTGTIGSGHQREFDPSEERVAFLLKRLSELGVLYGSIDIIGLTDKVRANPGLENIVVWEQGESNVTIWFE